MTIPSFDDLSQKTGLPLQTSQDLQVSLVHDLMVSLHRSSDKPADRARNERIETVYKQLFNEDLPDRSAPAVIPTLAFGLPGTGLNATFHAAARQTADLLGMTLKSHPSEDDPLGPNDLVVHTMEVPKQEDLPADVGQRLIKKVQQGGGGIVLVDFDNAPGAEAMAQMIQGLSSNILRDAGVMLGGTTTVSTDATLKADLSANTRTMFRPVLMAPHPILGHKLARGAGTAPASVSNALFNRVTDMAINAQLQMQLQQPRSQQRFPSLTTLVKKLDQQPASDHQDSTPSTPSRRQP